MFWLSVLCIVFIFVTIILLIKIIWLHKTVDEICTELNDKLENDTNNLITISSRNRHMMRLAKELNKQLRLLRKERRKLQSGDLELKEAVTNISHDIRTPLTAILGYLDLVKREDKSEKAKVYLEIIENRSNALKQLTEEFFQYAVIVSAFKDNNFEELMEEITLNCVLEESISAYYAALKRCGIVPKISIPEEKIIRKLNKNALMRVFSNIINNAIKYSDGNLEIILKKSGDISFTNSTSQMDEVQVGKLFDRFYTVRDAKKSTGIGLSIAKALMEQMNGTITASYENSKLNINLGFKKESI